jgi:hypothetical protein
MDTDNPRKPCTKGERQCSPSKLCRFQRQFPNRVVPTWSRRKYECQHMVEGRPRRRKVGSKKEMNAHTIDSDCLMVVLYSQLRSVRARALARVIAASNSGPRDASTRLQIRSFCFCLLVSSSHSPRPFEPSLSPNQPFPR